MLDRSVVLCRGWTIVLRFPPDWLLEQRDNLVIARKNSVEDLSIAAVEKVAQYSLWDVAEAAMQRHVRQGEPDRFPAVVSGHPAFGYEWSDGVQTILTWWLELDSEFCARVEYANGTPGRIRDQSDTLLAAIEIRCS